jgi:DNA-binding HxlR family transcriptional regulator
VSDRRIRFIERKGALEVLFEVERGEKRFTDIQENVEISSATLSNRLKEGKVEGLWKEELEESEDGSAQRVYVLSSQGDALYEDAIELNIPELIDQLQEVEAKYQQRLDELRNREREIAQ